MPLSTAEHQAIHRQTKRARNHYAKLRRRYRRSLPDVLPMATTATVKASSETATISTVNTNGDTGLPPALCCVQHRAAAAGVGHVQAVAHEVPEERA